MMINVFFMVPTSKKLMFETFMGEVRPIVIEKNEFD